MGTYFLWYGTGRAYLETLRLDPTEFHFLGEKINTDVAAAAAVFGLIVLIVQAVRHRGEPAPSGIIPGGRLDLEVPFGSSAGSVPDAISALAAQRGRPV